MRNPTDTALNEVALNASLQLSLNGKIDSEDIPDYFRRIRGLLEYDPSPLVVDPVTNTLASAPRQCEECGIHIPSGRVCVVPMPDGARLTCYDCYNRIVNDAPGKCPNCACTFAMIKEGAGPARPICTNCEDMEAQEGQDRYEKLEVEHVSLAGTCVHLGGELESAKVAISNYVTENKQLRVRLHQMKLDIETEQATYQLLLAEAKAEIERLQAEPPVTVNGAAPPLPYASL